MSYSYDQKQPQQQGGWPSPAGPPPSYGQPPQWGAPPPQGPPQQQWGAPQPQQASAPSQWSAPPQGPPQPQWGGQQQSWGPPQQGSPAPQWSAPPPPQGQPQPPWAGAQQGPPPQQWGPQAPQQQAAPPQPAPVTFRFSAGKGAGILNSSVTDPYDRPVFTISSDKKHTEFRDHEKRVVATVDWHHSEPVLKFQGQDVKVKNWIPLTPKRDSRTLHHNGVQYGWSEENGELVLQDGSGQRVGMWRDSRNPTEVVLLPQGLHAGLLEPLVIAVTLMASGRPIGDIKHSSAFTDIGILGGIIGGFFAS